MRREEEEIRDHITLQLMHFCDVTVGPEFRRAGEAAFSSTNDDTSAVSYRNTVS
jgi:hypothetical protein